MNNIIAIDPGSKGFVTFLSADGTYEFYGVKDGDMLDLANTIKAYLSSPNGTLYPVHCIMEEVHAVFGSSAKATFAFGEINGFIKGMMTAMGIPYTLVQPKQWQNEIWINQDKVYVTKENKKGDMRRAVDTKHTSYNAARRLFPNIDLKRTAKCRNFDDNKVDSLLISEYARRRNL